MQVSALLLAISTLALGVYAADELLPVSFKPTDFPKKTAPCKALNRHTNEIKNIEIKYVEINPEAERTLLMVHGWPSLWHSWKYQIEEFKDDYHIIAPDQRGFGSSTTPGDVGSSGTWGDLAGDLVCMLGHAGVERAICMGHDWGAQVCYEAARMRPDVFEAVIGAVVPYIPSASGQFIPISVLDEVVPKLAYQVFLSNVDVAAKQLNADIRRSLRATLRTVASPPPDTFLADPNSYMGAWDGVKEISPIPFFTQEEEDYWVAQYNIQEFKPTLEFYTIGDRKLSWQFTHDQGNYTISQPALSVLPNNDPVADWVSAAKILGSDKYLSQLTTKTLDGAHWVQLENPREFNAIVRNWLDALPAATEKKAEPEGVGRAVDEL
ncbi:Alpha/Beta hydrolase protein [Sparassis latifolia]